MPKGIPFQAKIRFILKAKLPSRRADRTSFLAFWGDSSFSANGSLRQGPGLPTRIVFEWERHEVIRSGGERNRLIEDRVAKDRRPSTFLIRISPDVSSAQNSIRRFSAACDKTSTWRRSSPQSQGARGF